MSNIGKQLLYIPKNVSVFKFINFIIFNYKNNIYKLKTFKNFKILFNKNALSFFCKLKNKKNKALWGTLKKISQIVLFSVFKEHHIKLKFIGVGFKAFFVKSMLVLRLGFSHKIFLKIPKIIKIKKVKKRPPVFFLSSWNIEHLKKISYNIRKFKKPEPYKGKGIVFLNEKIIRKEGKKSKK
jgi:large subunit ribosomal protein L6